MGFAQWMRVLDTISGLVQLGGRMRRGDDGTAGLQSTGTAGPLGQLEARLAGVVVAALKEAFDRDSTRLELERSQIEAERQRAEAALQAELRRQAADRALDQLRIVAIMAIAIWALSAALGVWLVGMREGVPRVLLGLGWLMAIGTLGAAFTGWQRVSTWSADTRAAVSVPPDQGAAAFAPWLLLSALALTGASLLLAL